MKRETLAVHAGEKESSSKGAVNVPIYQSSTYLLNRGAEYHDVKYMRLSNSPNHLQVHTKLARLEAAEAALVTASGMAAISTALFTCLKSGEHMLAQNALYGGTHDLLRDELPRSGISYTYIDVNQPESWFKALTPQTKVFYVEAMSNPLLQIGALDEVVKFCKQHNLIAIIDNTFLTPVLFRPLEMGFDLVVHSATKALNGHSDIIAGAIMGSKELISECTRKLNHTGGFLDVHCVSLLNRGLKTLILRVERQCENALELAQFLKTLPKVERVIYPGLEEHPQHQRARTWFSGFGTMLGFELKGGAQAADEFMEKLHLFLEAPSLGGVESLITRPATSSHSGMSPEQRRAAGLSDSFIRVSVGVEHIEDLKQDILQALN